MCGIFGVISKRAYGFINKDIDVFDEMLYVGALRGMDATGVITVEKDASYHIDKAAKASSDFAVEYNNSKSASRAIIDGMALIGHNRKGTVGGNTDDTAHPFVVKNHFAMVHNGTLYNHKKLADTTVDSEALAIVIEKAINSNKPKEDLQDTMYDVFGAYACVWYNQVTHKVQLMRNSERPLWIAENDDGYYFASEGAMLHWIMGRNGLKYKTLEQVPEECLFTFDLNTKDTPLTKEYLSIKKFQPTPTPPKGSGHNMGMGIPTKGGNSISKQEFKRLRKTMLWTYTEFFVDDAVEKTLFANNGMCEDFLIMGQSEEWAHIPHVIKGEMNIDKHQFYDPTYLDSFVWRGQIVRMEFNDKSGSVEIFVDNITKLPPSFVKGKGKTNEAPVVLC